MGSYQKLLTKYHDIMVLRIATGILQWDLETYIPPSGVKQRSEQLALLEQLMHRMITSPELGELLNQSEKKSTPDPIQQRNLQLIRKEYHNETKLPEELVAKIAKQRALTVDLWKKAKETNDWKRFEPELKIMFNLTKQKADILKDVKEVPTSYDALLDEFEPGLISRNITQIFTQLRQSLIPIVNKSVMASETVPYDFLEQSIPIPIQRELATSLATHVGFDVTSGEAIGRIDETEHPFTVGYGDDVRITVHYYENNVASGIYGALHELGHALYDHNMNPDWIYQPVSYPRSFGVHESQSRFIENFIGRSREFWVYYLPHMNKITNGAFTNIELDDFMKAINRVQRSKIRIEADEVTYSLHIIIRFEIEQDLFADKIDVSELPSIWNQKYFDYLGVEIENDTEGVMQDTHWASGYFGYFPSYALGNIYGGQLLKSLEGDIPDWRTQMAHGNLKPAINWMSEKVHSLSGLYDPVDHVRHITGQSPTAKPYIDYLQEKYSQLYDI